MEKVNVNLSMDELLLIKDLINEELTRRGNADYSQSSYINELLQELSKKLSSINQVNY